MPRKNKSKPHTPYNPGKNDRNKRRYPSKLAAEKSAELAMSINHSLELSVYRGLDGGWYLTSNQPASR